VKKIFFMIKTHVKEDFQFGYYTALVLFLAGVLYFNYSVDLENKWIDQFTGKPIRILLYFLLYSAGYYITCAFVSYYKKESSFWRATRFWIFSIVGLLILSLDRGFPYQQSLVNSLHLPYSLYTWIYKITSQLLSFILIFLPVLLFYWKMDKVDSAFYGLKQNSNLKPYFYLLLVVAPIIILASTHESFTNYYPVYKANEVAEVLHWPKFLPPMIFELLYGADFLNVELLFRGFFVVGMAQILGKHAVMPMVVIYCFLHFGKPAGEAISSIFGGYILGIIALNTRSVWGGIIIHVGIAWMMEAAAYVTKHF